MDSLAEAENKPDRGAAAPALPAPGSLGADWERAPAAGGARAALSLGLAASLAGWQAFLHSPWGARLRALNEIVFVGETTLPDASSRPSLYAIHPDGSGLHRLVGGGDASYLSPAWSPDGSRIAAFAASGSAAHLMVMDADGSHARVVPAVALRLDAFDVSAGTNSLNASQLIAWSPDGTRLAAAVGVGQYALVNGDGTNPHMFSGLLPVWSPDGRSLAYYVSIGGTQNELQPFSGGLAYMIELLDTQTFQTRQLRHLPGLNAGALAWSPDGRSLAVSAFQVGSIRSEPVDSVMLVPLDGSKARMVGQWIDGQVEQIAWSPDSQKLAVVHAGFDASQEGVIQINGGSDVWVVNADGSNGHEIGSSDGGQPSWSPDGTQLVYASQDNTALVVADVSAPPKAARRVLAPALSLDFVFGPRWSPLGAI